MPALHAPPPRCSGRRRVVARHSQMPGQVRDALRRGTDKACAAAGETCYAGIACASASMRRAETNIVARRCRCPGQVRDALRRWH